VHTGNGDGRGGGGGGWPARTAGGRAPTPVATARETYPPPRRRDPFCRALPRAPRGRVRAGAAVSCARYRPGVPPAAVAARRRSRPVAAAGNRVRDSESTHDRAVQVRAVSTWS